MSAITVWFIRCAMVYFMLSMLLGLHMALAGPVYPVMPIHVHFNLLGWMSMMIYGVAYHILPRFSGKPLWSEGLSRAQLWLANIGLVGMALGWAFSSTVFLFIFSLVEAVSVVFFALNMFKTIRPAPAPPKKPVAPAAGAAKK